MEDQEVMLQHKTFSRAYVLGAEMRKKIDGESRRGNTSAHSCSLQPGWKTRLRKRSVAPGWRFSTNGFRHVLARWRRRSNRSFTAKPEQKKRPPKNSGNGPRSPCGSEKRRCRH